MTTTLTLLGVILVIGAMAYRRASLFTATLATAAALVAGTVVINTHRDVRRLSGDQVTDVVLLDIGETDVAEYIADQLVVIRLVV